MPRLIAAGHNCHPRCMNSRAICGERLVHRQRSHCRFGNSQLRSRSGFGVSPGKWLFTSADVSCWPVGLAARAGRWVRLLGCCCRRQPVASRAACDPTRRSTVHCQHQRYVGFMRGARNKSSSLVRTMPPPYRLRGCDHTVTRHRRVGYHRAGAAALGAEIEARQRIVAEQQDGSGIGAVADRQRTARRVADILLGRRREGDGRKVEYVRDRRSPRRELRKRPYASAAACPCPRT